MRLLFTLGAIVLCGHVGGISSAQAGENIDRAQVRQNLQSMPLVYTKNMGQWPDSVLFRADAGTATMWITSSGVTYQLTRRINGNEEPALEYQSADRPSDSIETLLIRASFVDANPNPVVEGEGLMDYKCNYFVGNDPANWRTEVLNYEAITLRGVYEGVDLRFAGGAGGKIVYQYSIAPGAEVSQVKLAYSGEVDVLPDAAGRMTVQSDWGEIRGLLAAPVADAALIEGDISLATTTVGAVNDGGTTTEHFGAEAVSLVYSTYLGGSSEDGHNYPGGMAVDDLGCAYVTAYSYSSDFPTLNAYDGSYNGGIQDAVVTKLSATGDGLVYSTFLGGSSDDYGNDIAVDAAGCAYVTGMTASSDFPTQNAYDASFNGGNEDAFVVKLSASGSTLAYSTFVGGSDRELGLGVALDGSDCAFLTGLTYSTDFPLVNSYDAVCSGGDAFLIKFSSSGNTLNFSTFLGGSALEMGNGISVDASGCAYVAGRTASSDFPTQSAYDATSNGSDDAFVTKFSSTGDALVYSTFLGGTGQDLAVSVAVDNTGCAYLAGQTYSPDFPDPNAYDGGLNGATDAFVTKFSAAGDALVYSTYLGGSGSEKGNDIVVDGSGCAYITGRTSSGNFPTQNAYDATANGSDDGFVTKFTMAGNVLVYSTYLGGSNRDLAEGIDIDASGCAYIIGGTVSTDFPTLNAYDPSYSGGLYYGDLFVTKLSALQDSDGDGVLDADDNCPSVANPTQEDADADGAGDICDECTDTDGDGFGNPGYASNTCPDDNCPANPNPGQEDGDNDGVGNVCDNCPATFNPNQTDQDADTFGAACDCDDTQPSIYFGATEIVDDGVDQDCNGFDAISCFEDQDQDGFGTTTTVIAVDGQCDVGQNEATVDTDCDDGEPSIHPGATEIPYDGVDQDCNGIDAVTCFEDLDSDGFGTPATVVAIDGACDVNDHESTLDTDCDDSAPGTHPGATEIPRDGIDQDCDGLDPCCIGRVGDANIEGDYPDEVTLGDIMLMVDALFISGNCALIPCVAEADVNQDGGANPTCDDHVTLGDIMFLVDFLFITGPENSTLPDCL